MKIASVAGVKAKFIGYLNASEQGPFVLTHNGRPLTTHLSIQEEEIERMLWSQSIKFEGRPDVAKQSNEKARGLNRRISGRN